MNRSRVLFFITGFLVAAILGFGIIQYAKGLRFDIESITFSKTGILVATSNPDGAQVFVNGKITAATNQNINLKPSNYDVEITKEGYWPWKKRLTIKAGEVVKTDATLFPKSPSLSPLTFDGVEKPLISPDGTKLAWTVPPQANPNSKVGLWLIELTNLPFGFARNARQITDADLANAKISFSFDGRNFLIEKPNGIFLLESGSFKPQGQMIALSAQKVAQLLESWQKEEEKETKSRLEKLPDELQDIMLRKTNNFVFSPDQAKVLYTATASALLADNLIPPIPGSSNQTQERDIKIDRTYVYDIKEDRNFLITADSTRRVVWLPTSQHLVLSETDKITIMGYDGTNKTVVWSGPYEASNVFPTPDNTQLIILTKLGSGDGIANLYSISLR